MKRIVSFVLALVLLVGFAVMGAQPVSAASNMKASDKLIKILKQEEGFSKYPMWDYGQYSVGYGTRCPDDMLAYYQQNGITEKDAELLLRNYLTNTEKTINKYLIDAYKLELSQNQFDALVSFCYNLGSAWVKDPSQNIHKKIVSGATGNDLIDAFGRWCFAGGVLQNHLLRRRLCEANMYLNGVYSRTKPENYCYVIYNPNGGTQSRTVQSYDSTLEAVPNNKASFGKNTFEGWYTAAVGGKKVEKLTAKHHGMTLYAHWEEVTSDTTALSKPVKVKVTVTDLNLRSGPGTNYANIGWATKGDTFTITHTIHNGGYHWGQYDGGWLCLQYTNFDKVKPEEPEETKPEETTDPEEATKPDESTDPEETKATDPEDTTEPETTQKPTEPEPTEPETTKPPAAEPAKVTGKVKADPYLCVRKGPGTGYATVTTLKSGTKVEILSQKTVGSMTWGKISKGWISMSYVVLDKTETESTEKPAETGKKGTVNCAVLNIRSGAGVTYGVVGSYRKGDKVTVTATKNVGSVTWGKTSKGWVSMDYITLSASSSGTSSGGSSSGGTATTTKITGKVNSDDVLRIRKGAGTSYAVVGYYNPGTKVTVTQQKTVGATTWGKTSKGWISMDYVTVTATSGGSSSGSNTTGTEGEKTQTKTVTAGCLYIRSGAGTNNAIVGYLYKGSKVTVTQTKKVGSSTWGKTANGWICLDYTK